VEERLGRLEEGLKRDGSAVVYSLEGRQAG
jgi:hypothetical protein